MPPPVVYRSFELSLEPSATGYRARVLRSPAGESSGPFDPTLVASKQSRPEMGALLFDALPETVRTALQRSIDKTQAADEGLRIVLRLDEAPELATLPWESLHDRQNRRTFALSERTPLVRFLPVATAQTDSLVVDLPLRILVVAANASDHPVPLAVEEEWARLQSALADLQERGTVALERLPRPTRGALQSRLRQGNVHVLHFVGHGYADAEQGENGLVLEREDGSSHRLGGLDLALLLHDHPSLRLVLINACQGGTADPWDSYAGVAQTLVQQGVPAVLAMQSDISDGAAVALTTTFYAALADGYPVDAALSQARKTLHAENGDEWSTPVLFSRSQDNRLFVIEAQEKEAPAAGEAPYRGMRYYDVADAALFFGREALTAELIGRLTPAPSALPGEEDGRFLAVVGASGSGKSSLVRAGLVAALTGQRAMPNDIPLPPGCERWQTHIITPTARPLESLAAALTRQSESVTATATLIDDLRGDTRSLHLHAQRHAPAGLLLVVDQFEELFTLCRDEEDRRRFVENLLYAGVEVQGPLRVVLTLRADFYAECSRYAPLRSALERYQRYIGPMKQEEVRRAILQPAQAGGWTFEPGLVEMILEDVGEEPGSLPLLSHALLESWQRRQGRTITFAGYVAAGKVQGAIARSADRLYGRLTPEQQRLARSIFLRLTELGEGSQDTRRRVAVAELIPKPELTAAVQGLLGSLADARLITTDRTDGVEVAEVAHEALIRSWPQLREWLAADRVGLRLHHRLSEAAQEWERLNRRTEELYRGARLAEVKGWIGQEKGDLNPLERAFLQASQKAEAVDVQRERRNRIVTFIGIAAIALLIIAALSINQFRQEQLLDAQATAATGQAQALATIEVQATGEAQARATTQAESIKAQQAARERRASELVTHAQLVLARNEDPSGSLPLLLAREAILITHSIYGTTSVETEATLGQLINSTPFHLRTYLQLGDRRLSHQALIRAVAFNPEGSRIVTGSDDRTAKVWDAHSGKELLSLEGQTGEGVDSVAFSPDGSRIITTGTWGSNAKVWDALSGAELLSLDGRYGYIFTAAFSPDGARILIVSGDGNVNIWDAKTGDELLSLNGDTSFFKSAAFSPDSSSIITANSDKTAKVWDAETGDELLSLDGHTSAIISAAFSPDGKRIITTSWDNITKIWNVRNGKEVFFLDGHTDRVRPAIFNPDGTRILTASDDGTAKVWGAETGDELLSLDGHKGGVNSAIFSPDGSRIVTASGNDTTVKVWDAESGDELLSLDGHKGGVNSAVFSPDSSRIVTISDDRTARIWENQSGYELILLAGNTGYVNSVAFNPDGSRVVTASDDSTAKVWGVQTGAELFSLSRDSYRVRSAVFSPDGGRIIATVWDTISKVPTAKVWDAETGKELLTIDGHSNYFRSAFFSPDGRRILTLGFDDAIKVWDAQKGMELFSLDGHSGGVNSAVFNPNGNRIVTAGSDGTAKVWDAQTGAELISLNGGTVSVRSAIFSPDGSRVLTTYFGSTTKVWGAETGDELLSLDGHKGGVNSAVFSTDSSRIVTASNDGTARVWDAHTGVELLSLDGNMGFVNSAAFSPDGKHIITTYSDCTVIVWNVVSDLPILTMRWYGDGEISDFTQFSDFAQFSPDGKNIITLCHEGSVRIWPGSTEGWLELAKKHIARMPPVLTDEEQERFGFVAWEAEVQGFAGMD